MNNSIYYTHTHIFGPLYYGSLVNVGHVGPIYIGPKLYILLNEKVILNEHSFVRLGASC